MDDVFLWTFGLALVFGAQFYAVTGWAVPGLIDKTEGV